MHVTLIKPVVQCRRVKPKYRHKKSKMWYVIRKISVVEKKGKKSLHAVQIYTARIEEALPGKLLIPAKLVHAHQARTKRTTVIFTSPLNGIR